MYTLFWTLLTFASTPQELTLKSLSGEDLSAEIFEQKVSLFINVASKCGYTPQYKALQELHKKYAQQGLSIIGVPCNQFGGQEPGSPAEILNFCKENYGVEFFILEKQDVNGINRSDLYKALVESKVGANQAIKWNFEKFLVDKKGNVVARYPSSVDPLDPKLILEIEAQLKK
jgi:glutathione peroxidase-family protein